ncbi:MAG TPA: hypothetical protein VLS93_11110 [Anaeromyxobacteraceae bacterium]|nr:hypothetical protein [Anaeromyxobacteraceae bacterium]
MWRQMQETLALAFERAWTTVLSVLPGFLAMLLVLLVAVAVALATRWGLRRSLARIGFDDRARAWGFPPAQDGAPGGAPSGLVARGAFWLILLLGLGLALDVHGATTTSELGRALLHFLPRLALAFVVFLVGLAASRFLERSVLISAVNMQIRQARLLSVGAKWVVLVLAAAVALEHVGVGGLLVTIAFSIVLGGIVLALALAVGLGSREAVSKAIEKKLQERDRTPVPEERPIQHL